MSPTSPHLLSYAKRAASHANPTAKHLLEVMERKRSNLAISVDVTKTSDFFNIVDSVGPFVCLVKTHVDIIEDFDPSFIDRLVSLSIKHDFLLFEDRKFADIGNTVGLQYSSGVYKIATWAHFVTAHPVPGPSVITGLASVGLPLKRGVLLLAEMSTKGSLAVGSYTQAAVEMAYQHSDFVAGFIAQKRMEGEKDFLTLTPGVALAVKGDSMGQQYRTPKEVIDAGSDVIIVGRGIYGSDPSKVNEILVRAKEYQHEGWTAYLERVGETRGE